MTRKDFTLIATALRDSSAPERVCRTVCTSLANAHPRFNIDAFLSACGVDH